ncbi:MAG: hypothetical protein K2X86_00060 [Cytophagaceae bacterium]|nr:hypothetical protein [Cytophagaceae bacterium]
MKIKTAKSFNKAAVAEAFEGEGKKYGCKTFVIKKGEYLTITLMDFMKKLDVIPNAFQKLLTGPHPDTDFPCVGWYKSDKEVMIRDFPI